MINFKIIIPMYNVEEWIESTLNSLLQQTYPNYNCVIVDDISTDSSVEIVNSMIKNDSRFTLIVNKEKKYGLQNIVEAIDSCNCDKEDVIVTLDGDDWLANKTVLEKLVTYYSQNDIWMTYGNHTNFPDGEPYWPLFKYPDDIVQSNNFRNFRFLASHLRTFKFKLWDKIDKKDLLDQNGKYFQTAWDLAIMFPMLEMSSDKSLFIEETMYVYNNKTSLNDYKLYPELQLKTEMLLRTKPKYIKKEIL
jgi:glycosyltransferase involved in cell wall biosynthesis